MKVHLDRHHKFLEDFDERLRNTGIKDPTHAQVKQLVKEWYDFDLEVDELGTSATVEMDEKCYTMFALKYS